MNIPGTIVQVLAMLVLVVPGFVYQGVRIRIDGRSPGDVELSGRVLRAIVISTAFALLYALVLGSTATDALRDSDATLDRPRRSAALGLVGAFTIPALAAVAASQSTIRESLLTHSGFCKKVRALFKFSAWTRYDPRPTAWDVAFVTAEVGWFVRVKMADGTWYAGYWGAASWASTFPDPHSIFVEAEYQISADGTIGAEVQNTRGAVIQCTDAVLVELLQPDPSQSTREGPCCPSVAVLEQEGDLDD